MSDADERTPEQVWLDAELQRHADWAATHPDALARIAALIEPHDGQAVA